MVIEGTRKPAGASLDLSRILDLVIHDLGSEFSFLKILLDSIPSPIFITCLDSSIKYVNPALETITGYSSAELVGLKLPYPWWPPKMVAGYGREVEAGRELDLHYLERTFQKKNGEPFWVSVKIKALPQSGTTRYYLGIWEDLTERKIAEKTILEKEASYRNLYQSMAQGVIYFDRQGRVVSANAAAGNILNLSLSQILDQTLDRRVWDVLDENGAELANEAIPVRIVFKTGEPVKNIQLKVRKEGNADDIWLNVDAIPEFLPGEKEAVRVFVTFRDITLRKRAESQAKEALQEWQNTFDSIPDMVSIQDTEYRLLRVNRAYARALNKTPEELTGEKCFGQIHGSDCPPEACPHLRTMSTGKTATAVFFEPGLGLFLEVTTSPILDAAGKLLGSVHIARDISPRKAIEDRLAQVQEFNSQILAQAPNPILVITSDHSIQYVNPAFEKLTGFGEREVIGLKPPFPHWPADQPDGYRFVLSDIDPQNVERRFRKKSGEDFWVRVSAVPVRENGAVKYHLVNWADITELKKMNLTLAESEGKFRVLAEQSPNLIFINRGGRVIYANKKCEDLTGYSREEFCRPDFDFLALIAPEYRDLMRQRFRLHCAGEESEQFEYEVVAKDGRLVPVLYSTRLINYGGGPAILGTIVDISERKRAEQELAQRERLYESLFENMLNGFAYCRMVYEDDRPVDFVYLAVNKAFSAQTGLVDVTGKKVSEVIPGIRQNNPRLLEIYGRVATEGIPMRFEDYQPSLDMWFSVSVYSPARGFFVSVFDVITERKRAQEDLKNSYENTRRALQSTIDIAARMVEMKDPYTAGHQQRVAKLATAIAREMHLAEDRIAYLGLAAKVHDIGKIHVPAEILNKTGRLSELEFNMMMTHAQGGFDVLSGVDFPWPLAQIVVQHHERLDGSGYPQGLKGEEIMLESRIIAVADTVEAMSGHRPYRPALGLTQALAELRLNRGRLFDEKAVDACLHLFEQGGFRLDD
jgi:PAS domain S-box-containing protein